MNAEQLIGSECMFDSASLILIELGVTLFAVGGGTVGERKRYGTGQYLTEARVGTKRRDCFGFAFEWYWIQYTYNPDIGIMPEIRPNIRRVADIGFKIEVNMEVGDIGDTSQDGERIGSRFGSCQ
ncbi:hypothetical protein C451_02657 [Halococcus thailandensis JCM 13552]|uniref:Uncharacterized protein n=1 Tax=Halococcus thailandensis JCM 13552 TaxID=1227457 RepID=M0NIA1_9EURY|nr:hypothetical protein C451_02657 [Halococcus thailandensis JCM 13552]